MNCDHFGIGSVSLRTLVVSAVICWSGLFFNALPAMAEEGELSMITPVVHQERIMNDVVEAFEGEHPDIEVRDWRPIRDARHWPNILKFVDERRKGTDFLLVAREDWEYRAPDEYKEKLRYVPMAQQVVYREGEEVGSVEYGLVVHREDVSDQAELFLEFIDSEKMREVLDESDPYHYASLEREVKEFEPPEWFGAPWEGPKPIMWHGVCQIWESGPRYFTTILGELKVAWMQGYDQVQGTPLTEPVIEWAEDHGMALTGLPPVERRTDSSQHTIEQTRRALEFEPLRGWYSENEDDLDRVSRSVYTAQARLEADEDVGDTKKTAYETVKEQFPRWVRRRHGDLETVNRRWGTSYESWDEIGLPPIPLDWVSELIHETGEQEEVEDDLGDTAEEVDTEELIYRLFHEPLELHVYAEDARLLDFHRYMREAWARKYKAIVSGHGPGQFWDEEFINYARQTAPLIANEKFYYTTKSRPDPYLYREVEEFNAAGYAHPQWQIAPHKIQMAVDVLQTAKGWPVWNAEHHMSPSVSPQSTRYTLLHTYLMGQFKTSGYNRAITFKSGRPDNNDRLSSDKWDEFFQVENRTRVQIRRNESVFRAFVNARAEADIAVLVTEANRAWNTLPDHPERPEMGGAVKAFGYMGALGRDWKYVLCKDASAAHVTGKLVIDTPWLENDTLTMISELPENRDIIVVGELPTENEYGEALPEEKLEKVEERATTVDGWDEIDQAIEPLEGLSGPYTEVGKADFLWWGRVGGRVSYSMPVPRLEVRRVEHDGNLYVAVTNHSSEDEISATIPWAEGKMVRELTTEDSSKELYEEGTDTSFEPLSVNIYEITDE